MNTFTVALAAAAIGAEASYHRGGYSHGRPAYSQGTQGQHVHAQYYNPHAAPAAEEPFVQPHVNTHRYGSHANKTQYDRRYPDAHGNYNHGGLLPKYESPHSHLPHRHTVTTDPWGEQVGTTTDTTGWWSPHRQFSPPLVKYVPAELKSTVYTKCALSPASGVTVTGSAEIAQDPHRPSSFRAEVMYTPTSTFANSAVRFDVYTTGDIPNTEGVLNCDIDMYDETQAASIGEVFHPLKEVRNGVTNPYADPTRGVIADIGINEAATGVDKTEVQKELLMDLAGKDSLIGRALYVTEIDTASVTTRDQELRYVPSNDTPPLLANGVVLGCCVIARVGGPAATLPPQDQVWQQSIHTQYHAADPQHEQHTHDAPTYGNDYGNSPAPQSGYRGYGHGRYASYPQKSYGHEAFNHGYNSAW